MFTIINGIIDIALFFFVSGAVVTTISGTVLVIILFTVRMFGLVKGG